MPRLTASAHLLFAAQHGVASTSQLIDVGLGRRQIDDLARAGAIELVVRGAYRSPSVPLGELARCAAVCLARPDVVIAGPTAGRLWDYRRLPGDHRIHVIAPRASNPAIAPWVAAYRTNAIHDADIVDRPDGIRITSRERTAFDLARWLGGDDLLSVIEQAVRDGHLSNADLYAVASDWLSPQRRWATTFVRQVDRRLGGGAADSHPEVVVAHGLERRGVRPLVRQHPLQLPDFGTVRFDLAVPLLKWAIEIDVHPSHAELTGRARDHRRDLAASAVGWITSRIDCDQYKFGLAARLDELAALHRTLTSRTPESA